MIKDMSRADAGQYYMYIYIRLKCSAARPLNSCVSPLFESTVGEVLSVQHQPSTFVDAAIRNIRVPLSAAHLRA